MISANALAKTVTAIAAFAGIATFVWTAVAYQLDAGETEKREWAKALVQQELLAKDSASFDELFAAYQSAGLSASGVGASDLSKESFRRVMVELQQSGAVTINTKNEFYFYRYDQYSTEERSGETATAIQQGAEVLREILAQQRSEEKLDYESSSVRSSVFRIIYANSEDLSIDDIAARVSLLDSVDVSMVKDQIKLLIEAGLLKISQSGKIVYPCRRDELDNNCGLEGN